VKIAISWGRKLVRSIPGARELARALRSLNKKNRELRAPRLRRAAATSAPAETGSDGLPLPPAIMRHWVAGTEDPGWFLESGRLGAETIVRMLEKQTLALDRFDDVLDFGCGCGRIIRYLMPYRCLRLHGTDSNPLMITWCDEYLEFAEFSSNRVEPPLRYRDGSFDFVYAFSVFTHLPASLQRPWMEEFKRVIKPRGILLLSLHGDHYLKELDEARAASYRSGNLVVTGSEEAGRNICAAFHPEAYVRAVLSKGFAVIDYVPEGALGNPKQDVYLLKRP